MRVLQAEGQDANFWLSLKAELQRELWVQAPMEDVSDMAFRQFLAQNAAADVYFTEFCSARGLAQQMPESLKRLEYSSEQRPIVAQLWGAEEEDFRRAIPFILERGFAGLDINMGCPHRKIIQKDSGSGLLQKHLQYRALKIIEGCQAEIQRLGGKLALSVKTRLGFAGYDEDFLVKLLSIGLDALIVHFRLAKPSKKLGDPGCLNYKDHPQWLPFRSALGAALQDGPAYWHYAVRLLQLRSSLNSKTLLLGNGGLGPQSPILKILAEHSYQQGPDVFAQLDGVMLARAFFDDPLVMQRKQPMLGEIAQDWHLRPLKQRLSYLFQHLELYAEHCANTGLYPVFKKFYRVYLPCKSAGGAGLNSLEMALLEKLQASESSSEAERIIADFSST